MGFFEAIAIVIELAEQNVIDAHENPEENQRQLEALQVVRAEVAD